MRLRLLQLSMMSALAATIPATAQDDESGPAGGPPKWSVGALGLYYATPFAAEDDQYMAVPYVAYRGERFFIEGTELGFHLMQPSEDADIALSVDLIAAARMQPGKSRDKVSADLGLRARLDGPYGSVTLTALRDVTDTYNGTELAAAYAYDFVVGNRLVLSPSIGVKWQSRKLANHMWGVTEAQHDRMVEKGDTVLPVYQLSGSVLNVEAGLTAVYRLADSWTLIGFTQASRLDKDIRANPGIDKKHELTMGLGIAYNF
ncbi:MAG: MipA/OmpV family protein [Alphaproteobacteria bacterium]|nr:MAG: MipA/OmpV family protein [Alphaproteobacteria bacterium]